jgi:hypothetical protein
MKRVVIIASVAVLLLLGILLHTSIKNYLWVHPWLLSALTGIPAIALALVELGHSREANLLRSEANRLKGELDTERNKHLEQIAENTKRSVTQAERNAETLRKHLRAQVTVSEGDGNWPTAPEIVEVSEDNIVTLFTPSNYSSSSASCVKVRCEDLEITDIPLGSYPLRLKVLKRYGPDVELGVITQWEERNQPAAVPTFSKGGAACHATYSRPGSSERRSVYVYASSAGDNSFLLEASTGVRLVADNKEISKRFVVLQVEYEAEGFQRDSFGTNGSQHRLFIR